MRTITPKAARMIRGLLSIIITTKGKGGSYGKYIYELCPRSSSCQRKTQIVVSPLGSPE